MSVRAAIVGETEYTFEQQVGLESNARLTSGSLVAPNCWRSVIDQIMMTRLSINWAEESHVPLSWRHFIGAKAYVTYVALLGYNPDKGLWIEP